MDDKLPESFFDSLLPADAAEASVLEPASTARDDTDRLMDHWPGAVFCLDASLRCHRTNPEGASWSQGPTADELRIQPQPLTEWLPETLTEALLPALAGAWRGTNGRFQVTAIHPSRGERRLDTHVRPDVDGGRVRGVFVFLTDLTDLPTDADRGRIPSPSARVRSTESHLRQLVDSLHDAAIFFLDAAGRVSDWTPSAERLFGHTAPEMVGRGIDRFAPLNEHGDTLDDPVHTMALGLERAALLGQSESSGWQRRADGSLFWAHAQVNLLSPGPGDHAGGYACLMRDMTENKRLVDMLQVLNADLEQRVEERTMQLQEINRDLEAFSLSVSHDLRAPLRHISSFVQLLSEDLGESAAPGVRRQIETIAQAADHMGQLIEGLLAFSRLGRAALKRRPVNMAGLLQSSLNRVQHDPTLHRPDTEVQWQLTPDMPTVEADPLLLSQVWDNLLANALKYSRPRPVAEIRVGWQATPAPDGRSEWVFWVRDNGVGFHPHRADRLFGMFQRLHRASEFEGTGIGLALCRRILERHGGRIWADSVPGEGSTFFFSLPATA